jgi:uncharacterized membrane protein (TIGR02234 family)
LQELQVTGSTAAPALTALALAGLALGGALAIAGPVIRVVLGLLEVLLGVSVSLAAVLAISNPAAASAAAVTAATGIAGRNSAAGTVTDSALTAWPFVAAGAGVLMVVAGVLVVGTARRWPGPTNRYQATRFEPVDGARTEGGTRTAASSDTGARGTNDAVGDWDDLSRGDDPTA